MVQRNGVAGAFWPNGLRRFYCRPLVFSSRNLMFYPVVFIFLSFSFSLPHLFRASLPWFSRRRKG